MRTVLLMAVAVVAVSLSGPVMAAMVVPPLAIAFWRNGFATVALFPAAATRHRDEIVGLGVRQLGLLAGSGLALALHFGTWVTSLTMTSVASATAIVCLQLAWVVAWQLLRGQRFGVGVLVGLALAFAGVVVVVGVDVTVSWEALVGDLLALLGGMAAAAYILVGSRARQVVSTTAYTFVCYGACALLLAAACLVAGQAVVGFTLDQWALLVFVTLTAQLLGHSVFNHLLAVTSPVLVSLALLLEVPGASLIAAWLVDQRPPLTTFVGLAVILTGMALVTVMNRPRAGAPQLQAPVD